MSATELVLQAKTRKASELLLIVGSAPKAKISESWQPLRSEPFLLTEWQILTQTLLNSQQQAQLDTMGSASGEAQIGQNRIGFSFFQEASLFRILLNFHADFVQNIELNMPTALLESVRNPHGLSLFLGQDSSQVLACLYHCLEVINKEKSLNILVLSSDPFPQIKEEKATFVYHQIQAQKDLSQGEIYKGMDLIVFHGVTHPDILGLATRLAEEGQKVFFTAKSHSILFYLKRILSDLPQNLGKYGVSRFADVIEVLAHLTSVKSNTETVVSAVEMVLMKPHLRQYLISEDLKSFESLLNGVAETKGLLTLNQSLLQLLIRRKINVQSAFQVSREPDVLDQQLKKLGV